MAKGFGDKLKNAISSVNGEIAKTNKFFSNLIGAGKTRAERENINDDFGIARMEEQKKQALVGKEGVEAAKIELEWTKKIEDAKEKQSKKHLQDVKDEIALVEENLKKQEEAQKKAENKFKASNKLALDAFNSNVDDATKNRYADDARIAKSQWKAFEQPIEELKKRLEGLRTQELKASKNAQLAPDKKRTAIMEAEAKVASETKKEADNKAKKAEEEAKKKAIEDEKRQKAELDKQKKDLENQRKQIIDSEKRSAVERLNAHRREAQAAKELAEAEKNATNVLAQWKNNRGQGFGDWQRGQNAADRAAAKKQRQEEKNLAQANNDRGMLAGRLFDKDGYVRKSANAFDMGRFADVANYLGFEGITDDQMDAMRAERDRLGERIKNNKANGQEKDAFQRLDKALGNYDKVKDAEQKRKDAEDREKKRAENEDKRTQSLEEIEKQITKLVEKAGV